jgi:hypothetical protein
MSADAKFALDGVARNVPTPAPRPLIPPTGAAVAVIVPEPEAVSEPPVPTTIAAVVFVPLVRASKPTAPPDEPVAAAVIRPFASTVILALVKEPTLELTVANVPAAVTLPVPSNEGLV